MSIEWLNYPTTRPWPSGGLEALDIYGGVAVIDFARNTWSVALTSDYERLMPVLHAEQLLALSELTDVLA